IRADEPAVPTDFLDYLATDSLLNLANEQQLVNDEVRKASAIARYLSTYYLLRDASLRDDFAQELESLVARMAGALDAGITSVQVEIPQVKAAAPKLPKIELCAGSFASVNGLPFVRVEDDFMSPVGFKPPPSARSNASTADAAARPQPQGIASVYGAARN
ncbi:MAG TPA: hypothetical protein VJ011_09080, partial [Steroidobacteraceae bacterium]|nr:hypothetical protein [Steroidobacteraceae bacterium]